MAKRKDRIYAFVTALLSGSAILFIFVIIVLLLTYSYPSIVVYGYKYLTTLIWNPQLSGSIVVIRGFEVLQGSSFGILVFIVGTLLTSALALIFGVPAGLGIAIFLTRMAPKMISAPISFLVELLAGIPSVIYGFWGLLVLVPYLQYKVEPMLQKNLSFIPFLSGPVYSSGLLSSGLILALMIVPIIASISRDVMNQTPVELKEGAKALGLTNWEITRKIVLPYARTGIFGAVILGLGRAIGETMAVAMIGGGANVLPRTLFYPVQTMAAFMASTLDSAFTDPTTMSVYALIELALVLMIISMIVNASARLLVRQGFIRSPSSVIQV